MSSTETKRTWVSVIARVGFLAKGIVYFMVGLLALQASIGMKGGATGTKQTLKEFIYQPFGSILLIGCAIGLLAHAFWKILQGILDPENRERGAQTVLLRIFDFLTGCLYVSFSFAAWQIFRGLNTTSSEKSTEIWVSKILELPYGKWIVLLAALLIVIIGAYQFYAAYTSSFANSFDTSRMSPGKEKILLNLGRIGFIAWGVVYLMIGYLFYNAAIHYNPNEAGGLAQALNTLRDQPYGMWILGSISVGLITYGIYLLVLSYYHKVFGTKPGSRIFSDGTP